MMGLNKKFITAVGACFYIVLFLSAEPAQLPAPELRITAFRKFGTDKPDSIAAITPPDGLAFTKNGLLVATDAMHHRIQIFNPRTGEHLGSAGDSSFITGLIVNVISLPDDGLLVSDENANQAYHFEKVSDIKAGYRYSGKPLFKDDGFKKLNGLACDSNKRIYVVDGEKGDVRRYLLPDFRPDPNWQFQALRPDNKPILNHSEGIAIDEKKGVLFLTGEWDGVIHAFNLETGKWLGKTVGCRSDVLAGKAVARSVFQKSVEGLAVIDDYLLAVDEGQDDQAAGCQGHVLIFDLRSPALYATGDEACRSRTESGGAQGLVGWFGSYRSSDAVAIFTGCENIEAMVAVADQGANRVLVYFWKDILEALRQCKKDSH